MNKNLFIAISLALSIVVTSSCERLNSVGMNHEQTEYDIKASSHTIPINQALESRIDFYCHTKGANYNKDISNIIVITSQPATRSLDSDTLLYIVNYVNNNGYDILAADDRIPSRLILSSNQGQIDSIPTHESGLSIGQAVIQDEDRLVGGPPSAGEQFILDRVIEFARYMTGLSDAGMDELEDELAEANPYITIPGYESPDTWIETRNDVERIVEVVPPLITTNWGQKEPYNKLVPKSRYAGCVPISIAQIITHNGYPKTFFLNGVEMKWDDLKSKEKISITDYDLVEQVSTQVRAIQLACKSLVFSDGTFTFPSKAANFLKNSMGYSNVNKQNSYDYSAIKAALKNRYPVFAAGSDGPWLSDIIYTSHAWIVDGLKNLVVDYEKYDHKTGEYLGDGSRIKYSYLHCIWGEDSESWVSDHLFWYGKKEYTDWHRMITYEIPKE